MHDVIFSLDRGTCQLHYEPKGNIISTNSI